MSKLRLFFALWPDERFSQHFSQLVAQSDLAAQGKKIAQQNLHLTLAFLGDVEETRLCELIALCDGISASGFDLRFTHLGYWKRPQVVWAGVEATPAPLVQLVAQLQVGLKSLSFSTEDREYVPHLTLLRKVARRPRLFEIEPYVWPVRSFCLVNSVLSPAGSQYQVLKSWPLSVANG